MACYLFFITMGKKNVVLVHVTKWINIKNIFSEKIHIEKATQIPYSPCLLGESTSIKFVQMSENLSNSLKKNWMRTGKKIHSYNLTIAESGSGAVDYITM